MIYTKTGSDFRAKEVPTTFEFDEHYEGWIDFVLNSTKIKVNQNDVVDVSVLAVLKFGEKNAIDKWISF